MPRRIFDAKRTHPLIAIVIIAAPWIFGFSDVGDAKAVCITVGVVMLIAGSMTDWRLSIARVIPLRVHKMTDLLLGAVLEILTALATRWDPAEAEESAVDRRSRSTPAH